TNGSRMKLVTSSRAIVRAALNDAIERVVRSSQVWSRGSRSSRRATPPANASPPAKTPMILAYASSGGRTFGLFVLTAMEATLGPNGRVQNKRLLSTDRRPADGGCDPGRRARGRGPHADTRGGDRYRKDRDDGLDDREGRPAGTHHRAQQDACRAALQRVPRVLPGQRRRVLRLLLRLLPAGGLRASGRPLHREGLISERRHRAAPARGDLGALHPPGRG